MTASGQDSVDNCNEGKMRRKDDSMAQLPVRFFLDQESIDNYNEVGRRRKEERGYSCCWYSS